MSASRTLFKLARITLPMLALPLANAQTIGVHLVTLHVPDRDYLSGANPGLYFKADNGITAGFYRNSLARTSVYAGWTVEKGIFSLTAGVVRGYQRREIDCRETWAGYPAVTVQHCDTSPGTKTALAPLLSPSVRLPGLIGVVPRLTLVPALLKGDSTALHLSLERSFD